MIQIIIQNMFSIQISLTNSIVLYKTANLKSA